MSGVYIEDREDPRFGPSVRLTNGDVELSIPRSFGPRIMFYGFCGGVNELCSDAPGRMEVGDETWKMVGGHRFWHSPEAFPRTYMPDNEGILIEPVENGLRLIQKEEKWVQVQKELELRLASSGGLVNVIHKLTNKNAWDINLALWGITMMEPGGEEWIPQPDRESGLLCNRHIALWPYTRMDDARLHWGSKYIRMQQDPGKESPCKLGLNSEAGWAAYFNHGNLFLKGFRHDLDQTYPDGGCSYETYTTDFMLEMESLSPLITLKAGESYCHREWWNLVPDVAAPKDEEQMDKLYQEIISENFLNKLYKMT